MRQIDVGLDETSIKHIDNIVGLVFHIIHGSFVDGYGVRTTVFLKGCPLGCFWCCNPEGQEGYSEIKFTTTLCDACGRCIEVCPTNAIQSPLKPKDDKIKIDRKLCTNCGKCIDVCYGGALDFFGKCMTVGELFNIVKKDEQFYRESGGGVTIGGGEPTFQPLFTLALVRKLKENYIHTALDTCGYTVTSEGRKALEEADLLLYDLKVMEPEEHLKCTGVSNEPILRNLRELDAMGKPIIIRIPLVPGYTDTAQNIRLIGEFLYKLKAVERVDLLTYHEYGAIKYGQLGRLYALCALPIQPPTQEHLNCIKDTLERYGLNVQLGG
jgi:pyruvate formate lyase activating enzyme